MPSCKAEEFFLGGDFFSALLQGGGVFLAEASQERCGQLRTFVFCNFQKMKDDFLAYSTKKNDIYGQLTNF